MENELYHHGIRGMHWGIRRFQNRDGSRTALGKRNRRKDESENQTKPKVTNKQSKSLKDLSNDEIKTKLERMKLEKDYYETSKRLSELNPKQVSSGEKFVKYVGNKVIAPALTNVGKQYLETTLKKKLGVSGGNSGGNSGNSNNSGGSGGST